MRKTILMPFLFSALLVSACSSEGEGDAKASGQVTQTRMDDIDRIEGTINDDMINVDESTEAAALAKDDATTGTETESDSETAAEQPATTAPQNPGAPVE